MKMEILTFDSFHSSVVSTDTRWRRGCTTDGSEITKDSEMAGKKLSGLGQFLSYQTSHLSPLTTFTLLGCEKLGDRSEDKKKIVSVHVYQEIFTDQFNISDPHCLYV